MRYLTHAFLTRLIACTIFFSIGQLAYSQCTIGVSTQTNVACFGGATGSVTLTGGGGVAPYSFQLGAGAFQASPTFTGLAAGTYTVTVRDAAGTLCTQSTSVTITQPAAALGGTPSSTADLLCSGLGLGIGSATATATGGTGPYLYSLNGGPFVSTNTFGLLGAGNYTITIRDANLCTFPVAVTVNAAISSLNGTTTKQDIPCAGGTGSITATATGGTSPYRYRIGAGNLQSTGTFTNLDAGSYVVTVVDNAGCARDLPSVTISQIPSTVTGAISNPTNAPCSGAATGAVTITGSGGVAPYEYRIGAGPYQASGTFSGLAAGTYSVTVRDAAQCVGTVPVTIVQDPSPVTAGTTGQVNAPCSGASVGQVTLVPGGGTAPYEFRLGNGTYVSTATFTGLSVGPHTFTVRDALLCTKDVVVTITQAPSPVAGIINSQTQVACNGTTATATVSGTGGLAPYEYKTATGSYQTSGTFTNLAVGAHVITIKDANNCLGEVTVNITKEVGTVTAVVQTISNVPCMGGTGSVTITPGGGTPTYLFRINNGPNQSSPTFNGLAVGDYTVTVQDALGCTKDVSFTISQPANTVVANTTGQVNAVCVGGTGSITGVGTGGSGTYTFSLDAGLFQTNPTFTGITPGAHTITVRDANGCSRDANFTITQPTAVTAGAVKTDIPCPGNTGSVVITGGGGTAPYQYRIGAGPLQTSGSFTGLTAASYTATVQDANGCTGTVNFTIAQNPNTVTASLGTKTDVPCSGGTASATIVGGGGVAPYQFRIGAGTLQATGTFTGLAVGSYTATVIDANGCSNTVNFSIINMPNTVVAAVGTKTDVGCVGGNTGAVTINGSGGTAPLEYKLGAGAYQSSPTFTNLAVGTYTATVKDANGCTRDVSVIINQLTSTVVASVATQTEAPCSGLGATATISATGGNGTYTYRIGAGPFQGTGTFTGLAAGTYTVTARDGLGCTDDVTLTIVNMTNTVGASATKTDITCAAPNGTATVTGSGGTTPYTYRVDGGAYVSTNIFTGLTAGAHTLTVRDANGCTRDASVTIGTTPNTIVASVGSKTDVPCGAGNIGAVTISATGGVGTLQYRLGAGPLQVSPTFTGLAAGNYIVTVQDANSCTRDVAVSIVQLANTITASVGSKTDVPCMGGTGSVTIAASGGVGTLQYRLGAGALQASPTFAGLAAGNYTVTVQDANSCTRDVAVTIAQIPNTIVASVGSQTNIPCAGGTGSVTISASGGTGTLQYRLGAGALQASPTFSGLAAGTYTVTVQDANGCTRDVAVNITQVLNTIVASVGSQTNIPCAGGTGSVTITASGGTGTLQYRLGAGALQTSPTFAGLAAGSYTVTVQDAAGCTRPVAVNITQTPNTIVASVGSKTDVPCSGGTASVTIAASGGSGTLQYRLGAGALQTSPTFAGLAVGNYTVTVQDANGCTRDVVFAITQVPNSIVATVGSQVNIPCAGGTGSVTISASGGTGTLQYRLGAGALQASPTFSGLAAGTYTVTVQDASGCTKDVAVTITQVPNTIAASVGTQTNIPCAGGTGSVTITATGGTGTLQYRLGAGALQTSPTFAGLAAGSYTVTVQDANGCTRSVNVTITQTPNTIVASVGSKTDVSCAAATGSVTISATGGVGSLEYKVGAGAYQASPTFNGLAAGNYTATVRDDNGCLRDVAFTIATIPNTVTATLTAHTDIPCTGGTGTATITGGGGTAPYQYRIDGGAFQGSGSFASLTSGDHTVTVRDAAGCTKDVTFTIIQLPNTIVAAVGSKTDVPCAGTSGTVTISASGGTGTLNYRLGAGAFQASPTFTNLSAGNYTVTVRDANNCTRDVTFTILQLANTVNASVVSKTDIPCSGGTASATIAGSGGTAPYNYRLDGGGFVTTATFTGLATGSHTVTVRDANGCTDDVTFNIIQTPNTVTAVVASKTDIPCSGGTGSVTITGGGGTAPYQYKVGAGAFQTGATFSGLAAGTYTATVRDANGCTHDVNFTIAQIANTVIAAIASKTDVACAGGNTGAVTVAGGGGTTPYTYRIGTGTYQSSATFTALAAGTYTLTVRDANGCTETVDVTIALLPNTVTAAIGSKIDIPCAGGTGTITLAGGGGTAPYQYRIGAGAFQASATFNNLAAGSYTFTVRDAAGCTRDVTGTIVQVPNTVNIAITAKTDIPCSGGNVGVVTVAGSGGTAPYQYRVGTGALQAGATFNNLSAGDHIITVQDAAGCTDQVTVTIAQQANTVVASLVSKTDITCLGGNTGAINVNGSGGTAPYEYRLGSGAFQPTGVFSNLGAGNYTITVRDANGCSNNIAVNITQAPNTVTATVVTKTDITCSGGNTGAVTVAGGGGTAPYTYKLGNGVFQSGATFTNLPAGDHIITVRDAAGCTKDVTVTIIQTANTVTALIGSKTDIPCAGGTGSATITAGGGTAPYQYRLGTGAYQASATFNNLSVGDHVFTVRDAGGCTKDVTVTITQIPNNVVATLVVKTDVPCSGNVGSFTVAGSGGTAPYQYRLGTGAFQLTGAFVVLGTGTYTVTVRDANGCTKDINVTINQIASTVNGVVTAKTDVPCSGGSTGSLTISGSGGVAPYSYRIGTGSLQSSGVFNNLAAGDYTVRIQDALGCFREIIATVGQLNNTVVATLASKTDINCFGANNGTMSVTVSGGTAPYLYKLDNGVFQGSASFANLTPGDHTVTVRDAGGCTQDVDVTISQPIALLAPSVASKVDIPCAGGTGSATIAATGGRAPYEYRLGATGLFQASGAFTGLAAGSYTATVRDAAGCARDIAFIINQTTNTVTASVTSKTDIPCSGGTGSVTVAGAGGAAPYQYKLGTGSLQASGTFSGLAAGNYLVTVQDANGCTRDLAVIINQAVNNVTGSVTLKTDAACSGGNTGSVTVAGAGGTAPYTYSLNGGAFQAGATFNNLAAGDYTITVRDASGCTKPVAVNIGQAANTVGGTVTSKTDVPCAGGNIGAVTVAGNGGVGPYQYKLGTGTYQTSGTFTGLAAGSYVVTIRDASGCTNDLAVIIGQIANTVNGTITAQTNVPCSGGNVGSVTISTTGGTAPYTYKIGSGTYQAGSTFNNLAAGDYVVTIRDAIGCTKDVNVAIIQLDNTVTAVIASKTDISCTGGNTGTITVTAGGGTPPYQYKLGTGSYQSSPTFNNLGPGNYTITVRDAAGCTKDVIQSIVQLNNTVTAVVASKTDVPCSGGNVGAATITGGGGTAPYSYKLGTGAYQNSATFTDLASGTYTATVKDAAGCTKDVTFTIAQLNNNVTATVSAKTDIPCTGGAVGAATIVGGGGTAPYEFKLGTGAYQSSGTFNNLAGGSYTVTVKDALGCTKDVAVVIAPAGGAAAGTISPNSSDPLCEGDSKVLSASAGVSFQWYRNDTIITGATGKDYTATVSGRYSVEISNGSCAVKATNTVQLTFRPCVNADIFVPTAFTPNANNKNDKLLPRFNAVRELRSFKIYNRWGQLMYTTNVIGQGWDGTFKGVRQPMETYSWVLECVDNNGNSVKRSGKTILIR